MMDKWSTAQQAELLVAVCHIEKSLNRTYNGLGEPKAGKTSDGRRGTKRGPTLEIVTDQNEPSNIMVNHGQAKFKLVSRWPRIEAYRRITNLIHPMNLVKYLALFFISDQRKLDVGLNCRLWGRANLHRMFIECSSLMVAFLCLTTSLWRYMMLSSNYQFRLDVLVFLLSKVDSSHQTSVKPIKSTKRMASSRAASSEDYMTSLLFYRHIDTSNRNQYKLKLRPNRTIEARAKLASFLKVNIIWSIIAYSSVFFGCLPFVVDCFLFDKQYIRTYPSCCQNLELDRQLNKLGGWQITFDRCHLRRYTLLFDILDSLFLLIDSTFLFVIPISVTSLITRDLQIYWKAIERRIIRLHGLLERQRYRGMDEPSTHFGKQRIMIYHSWPIEYPLMDRRWQTQSFNRPLWSDKFGLEALELQSILIDFFQSLHRANRSTDLFLGFSFLLWFISVILVAHFDAQVPEFWDLILARYLVLMLFLMLMVGSMILLKLKSSIDKSYGKLCSIIALDQRQRTKKWLMIMGFFTQHSGTSFTVLKVKFTWQLAINLMVSSISFIVATKSLTEQSRMRTQLMLTRSA